MDQTPRFPCGSDLDRWLDRLVDGEISPDQRRVLLSGLDGVQDGWKRCAWAFLEAQAWQQDLERLVEPKAPPGSVATAAKAEPPQQAAPENSATGPLASPGMSRVSGPSSFNGRPTANVSGGPSRSPSSDAAPPLRQARRSPDRLSSRWTTWATVAASLLLAFLIGTRLPRPQGHGPNLSSPRETPVASGHDRAPRTGSSPVDNLTLVVDGAGDQREQQFRVPVVQWDDPQAEAVLEPTPVVSPEGRQALERMGVRVQQRQRWVPVRSPSGEVVLVPVEEVLFVPMERPPFQ